MDVMRQAFRSMRVPFQEDDGRLFTRLGLENVEVQVVAWGFPDDLAKVIVRLPVRAAKKHRAAAGDFLHRLNCNARRKFWEMDCDSGEISWQGSRPAASGTVQIYLDVSGSMNAELQLLVLLLAEFGAWIRKPLWAFSTIVVPATIIRGELQTNSTGGTALSAVLDLSLIHI